MLTPKPLHTETGLVNDCYSRPGALYAALREKMGEFPLMRYWGPMAGIESSKWIAAATEHVWRTERPDLCLTYLPHLDYNTQRRGPDPAGLLEDLKEVDALVDRLAEMAVADGAEVVILSEYSLSPVTRAVALNRVLREAGLLAVRELAGREYLDCGACGAFALADHQIAHIYFPRNREANLGRVKKLLQGTNGVAEVLDTKEQTVRGIRHSRSGDLIAVAEADAWFSYYYWLDDARAPDFARTVDIHRKPGYDPVELFFDPATRSIPLNTALVRGSHGRTAPGEGKGVFISSAARRELDALKTIRAAEAAKILFA
jgi:predicted AlkP superfamily pyrophosphatase or phosphodiesterase